MKIKSKLLLINNAAVIIILFISGFIIYSQISGMAEENIENNLGALNDMSFNIVENEVQSTFQNLLRFKSQQFLSGVKWYYRDYKIGKITESKLKELVKVLLDFERLGKSGYLFAINSRGEFIHHHDENLIGQSFIDKIEPIDNSEMKRLKMNLKNYLKSIISKKDGYFEYIDQRENNRQKGMYMSYLDDWDFILCASAYKDEYDSIINKDEVMKRIISEKKGVKNYFFVLDNNGFMISHRKMFPYSLKELKDLNGMLFIKEMIDKKTGKITYYYQNIADKEPQIKMAMFKHLKELDWVIVSVSNKEDAFTLVYRIRNIILIIGILILIIMFFAILFVSSMLTKPINYLMETIRSMKGGDLNIRAEIKTNDEIGELGHTFNSMVETIQDHTHNLEEKVIKRTEELNISLEEVKSLNEQMAGDYFLTSLIINPLMTKSYKSEIFDIKFYISQKKKFSFRKKNGEIGGDINIINSITLRNKKFTVFVNADAMGKSLQGAGGALVLGVVFNSFIARTKIDKYSQWLTPEKWLNECYNELQNIFETFDGSMLISVIIGMVDEVTGLMYYFNAEHPWSVLYRDNKAVFMQNELDIRKIGTVTYGEEADLNVRVFQMQLGDVVFLGSDGKDDLLTGNDEETGNRIINEDETLFLNCVEEAEGNLDKVVEIINAKGEITDDIALIRINYVKEPIWKQAEKSEDYEQEKILGLEALKENNLSQAITHLQKAVEIFPDELLLKELYKCYNKKEDINNQLEIAKKVIWYYPKIENLSYVYIASFLNKKLGNYQLALDYGETYRLYNPNHINNLITLADTYRMMGLYEKAIELIEISEKQDVENTHLVKLKKLLEISMKKD